jgi:hypothetical protein
MRTGADQGEVEDDDLDVSDVRELLPVAAVIEVGIDDPDLTGLFLGDDGLQVGLGRRDG